MRKYTVMCLLLSLSACASGSGKQECNMEGWNSFAKKVDTFLDKVPTKDPYAKEKRAEDEKMRPALEIAKIEDYLDNTPLMPSQRSEIEGHLAEKRQNLKKLPANQRADIEGFLADRRRLLKKSQS